MQLCAEQEPMLLGVGFTEWFAKSSLQPASATVVTVRITSSGLQHRIASESQDWLGEAENQSSRLILFHPVRELFSFQSSPWEATSTMPSCRAPACCIHTYRSNLDSLNPQFQLLLKVRKNRSMGPGHVFSALVLVNS